MTNAKLDIYSAIRKKLAGMLKEGTGTCIFNKCIYYYYGI